MNKLERIARLASAGLFVLTPGGAVAGGLALAPLVTAAGLATAPFLKPGAAMRQHRIPLILFVGFVAWAIFSTLWLHASDHGQALRLAGIALGGLLFFAGANPDPAARRVTEAAGAAALLTLIILIAVEAFANLPLNRAAQPAEIHDWVLQRNPGRAASILVVLTWAVLGALLARGGAMRLAGAAILTGVVAILSAQFGMQANLAAFSAGLAVFALGWALRGGAIIAVGGLLASWLLASPFVTPLLLADPRLETTLPQSWAARVAIWKFVCARIHEQPWIGHGLDSSRTFRDLVNVGGVAMHQVPLHPHSASLQIWLETGAVGAVLGAAALIAGAIAMARVLGQNRAACAAACATLVSFGLIANVSYGVWQEWWLAIAFMGAALVAAIPFKPAAR